MANVQVHSNGTISRRRTSILAGSFWMVAVSLLLFFVPLINGIVGGAIGGYKVGSVGRALLAALLPALFVGVGLWGLLFILDAPVWGLLAGMTGVMLIIVSELGLFVGAALGGALSPKREVA